MSLITIHVVNTPVHAALDELNRRCAHLHPAFDVIGQKLRSNILDCFQEEKSPDGINWAALSPVTIKNRRGTSHQILQDTGKLLESITYHASNTHAEVTTDAEYAAMMNFGGTQERFPHLWGDIPARPFFPTETLPLEWERDVMDVLNSHLTI